jgi:prepilin-type N-terminal cleavage/methylation domain-containing protein
MKSRKGKRLRGFTLIELLVVIGIIMILIAGMIKVAQSVQVKAKIKNTKSTISLLCAAMEEYRDVKNTGGNFSFPNGDPAVLMDALQAYLGVLWTAGDLTGHLLPSPKWKDWEYLLEKGKGDERLLARASIECLYCCLYDVPECQVMLNRLGSDVTSNDDNDWIGEQVIPNPSAPIRQKKPLIEVNDAWGHPLRYQWQREGNFPLISSAGEDGVFDTADDIISSEL